MKHWLALIILPGMLATQAFAGKGPEIRVMDNKVSMDVESIPLGRLLTLFDRATGLQSTVPAALANRSLSVKFADLEFEDAVRKIFEGQPLDYIVVERQGIIVTALSQASGPDSSPTPAYNPPPQQIEQQSFIDENNPPPPFVPPPVPGQAQPIIVNPSPFGQQQQQQQQPAMIQTPFGPIPNPRAGQPLAGAAPAQQQATPFGTPAQQQATPFGTPAQQQATPFGTVSPFNSPNPFGTQPAPAQNNNNNNNVFGNTSPPLFNQNQK
jgi:hypothetical protein